MTETADFIRGRNQLLGTARVIRSLCVGQGDPVSAHAFADAKGKWNDTPEVFGILEKSIMAPVSTASDLIATWLPVGKKINEALRPLTVFGRLQAYMSRVPFRTRVVYSSDPTEARFVGEATTGAGTTGSILPVTALSFSESGTVNTLNMNLAKLGIITVHTVDLIRQGPPGTEQFIAGELLRSLIRGLDRQFIDPARLYDAAREAPASITSGGTVLSSTGSTLSAIDSDLGLMIAALDGYGLNLSTAHWIMSPVTGAYLARLRGSSGAPAYPGVGARGGELLGLPVLTSGACAAEGSPGERFIALVEADQVTYADDDGALVEYSTQADLQMDSAPSAGATTMRSLWQNSLTACRVTLQKNWQARTGATAVLRNVTF